MNSEMAYKLNWNFEEARSHVAPEIYPITATE